MKIPQKIILAAVVTGLLFQIQTASAGTDQINVVNFSFETNTAGTTFNWKVNSGYDSGGTNNVAGWLDAGSTYNDSGVDYAGHDSVTAENGTVVAYCDTGDSGAYQITGYQMQPGDQLTLTWWAKSSWDNAGQSVSLMSGTSPTTAFGSLTTLATSTAALNQTGNGGAYTQYTLTYTAGSADAGNYVAIFFNAAGTNGQYAMFDSFALSTVLSSAPSPVIVNNSFETNTAGTTFTWKIEGGFDEAGTNNVAGWLDAGTNYNNSGVDFAGDTGLTCENGTVAAFCESGDGGAYQVTGYRMNYGDQLTLTWWAKGTAYSPSQLVSLLSGSSASTAFSSLTTLASSTAALNDTLQAGAYTEYTLTYTAGSADVGKYVGVFFTCSNPTNNAWATFDEFGLSVSTALVGPVSAANSTISPALVTLTANGGSTQTITVQARDATNNNETSGGATVVFSLSGTGTLSGTTDNGNGTYSATLTTPTNTGSATITATLGGTSVGTGVGASQCAATYFSSTIGSAVPNLTGTLTTNFTVGSATFQEVYYPAQGLGPIYNNSSCANCHNYPVAGGSGQSLLTRFGLNTNGVFNPLTNLDGTLLHAAFINANCVETNPPNANVMALRKTRMLFGAGLIEAIPDSVIENNATIANPDGIVGTVAYVTDPVDGKVHAGRFGWKAQYASLLSFVADAENNELGRTSRLQPVGHAPNGNVSLYNTYNTLADPNDVTNSTGKADIDRDSDYIRLLGPAPTSPLSANAVAGQALFHQISCDECHTPTLTTSAAFTPISDLASETNSSIAALSSKAVNLYSDLLLHNMGSLNDGIAQGAANTNQMMTAPLWGLQYKLPYLHDGRATNSLDTAIREHAGDAAAAATRYINLSTTQQQDLQDFINSL